MLIIERGGKDYAKKLILRWLTETGGSKRSILEAATGLPSKISGKLLGELMEEGKIELDAVIFKLR